MSSPDAGNGVAPSPDGTGGAPSSDKTLADKTSPSLDKAEPSTDPSSAAAVGAPDGSEQAVGAPEESSKGNIEEDVGSPSLSSSWLLLLCRHPYHVVTCICQLLQ